MTFHEFLTRRTAELNPPPPPPDLPITCLSSYFRWEVTIAQRFFSGGLLKVQFLLFRSEVLMVWSTSRQRERKTGRERDFQRSRSRFTGRKTAIWSDKARSEHNSKRSKPAFVSTLTSSSCSQKETSGGRLGPLAKRLVRIRKTADSDSAHLRFSGPTRLRRF